MKILDTFKELICEQDRGIYDDLPDWIFGDNWCAHTVTPRFFARYNSLGVTDYEKQIVLKIEDEDTMSALCDIHYCEDCPDLSAEEIKQLSLSCQKAYDASKIDKTKREHFLGFCIAQDIGQWISTPLYHKEIENTGLDDEGVDCVFTRIPTKLLEQIHSNIMEYGASDPDVEIW